MGRILAFLINHSLLNKLKKTVLIGSGFVIGQGSMFLAQTYLLLNGDLTSLANIGIALGLLSLIQWGTDAGGVFILPKYVEDKNFNVIFSCFLLSRLIIGFSLFFLISLLLTLIKSPIVVNEIFSKGWLVAIIWSFNISGILDYYGLNKLADPLSGLCWLLSSLYIIIPGVDFKDTGIFFSLGLFLTTIIQLIIFNRYKKNINLFADIKLNDFSHHFKSAFFYTITYSVSQIYARLIPIALSKLVDSTTAGVYIYVKNIINLTSQVILFSRRAEYSSVIKLIDKRAVSVADIIKNQSASLFIACVSFFCSLVLCLGYYFHEESISKPLIFLLLMQPNLMLWVISSSLGQYCIAANSLKLHLSIITLSATISLIIFIGLVPYTSLYTIIFSEFVMYILQISLFYKGIKFMASNANI